MDASPSLSPDVAVASRSATAGRDRARERGAAARRTRRLVVGIHRWTGLTVGMVLVFMAVTGSLIAYRSSLEPLLNASLLTVPACAPRVPVDELIASARAAHPSGTPDYVRIASGASGATRIPAVQVRMAGSGAQDDVFVDPCTGRVLGQRARYGGALAFIEKLHRFRFVDGGSLIGGTTALTFVVVLALGGLYLWWPRRLRGLRRAARFDHRLQGRDRTINRHQVVGVYAGLVVLSSALTGLPQSFDWYRHALYAITGSVEKTKAARSVPSGERQPMEAQWRRLQALVPDAREALLHVPAKPADPVEAFAIPRDAPHANARSILDLDAYSGAVLRFVPYAESSLGHKLYFWTLSWHTGEIGGPIVPLLLMFGALCVPFLAYTGASSYVRRTFAKPSRGRMQVRVARKSFEAEGVCTFELADPQGRALPGFGAGSHIDVQVAEGLVRQYSLCNDPQETHRYQIGVLLVQASRGGSAAMHESIEEGDLIEISKPRNHFPLAPRARRTLLIAGGIGITPILCMAERLSNMNADFSLHYCARSRLHAAFADRIARSPFAARTTFHFGDDVGTSPLDVASVLGMEGRTCHVYVCGPQGLIDTVVAEATRRGWARERIHREYFASSVHGLPDDRAFDVTIASTGRTIRVERDQTVAAALAQHGIAVPTSCAQGLCGTCLTRVLDGVPEHRDLCQTDRERQRNDQFTLCCSRASSPALVLDL